MAELSHDKVFSDEKKHTSMTAQVSSMNSSNQQASGVDEFLNFSTTKRGAHRRSVSDSIAFFEVPIDDGNEFDGLDDEQFTSLFDDEILPSMPVATKAGEVMVSTSLFNNIINREKTNEEKKMKIELEEPMGLADGGVDQKRVKRILANRQSAQRSRIRKLQYISELERSVSALQNQVSTLSPQVAFLDQQRSLLTLGNSHLKQRIAALAQDKIFKDAHQEALKKEIERLRQVYHQQTFKNMVAFSASNYNGHIDISCEEGQ